MVLQTNGFVTNAHGQQSQTLAKYKDQLKIVLLSSQLLVYSAHYTS